MRHQPAELADSKAVNVQQAFEAARIHHQGGRLVEAEAIYRQILAVAPGRADVTHLLGVLAGQKGRSDEAVSLLRQSIALRPDYAEAHKNLGIALKATGRLDEAEAAFRHAIALKPDYAEACKNLGSTLHQAGRVDEAITAYRQAIALQPGFSEAHDNLGVALRERGMLDEAESACRRAVALNPRRPESHNNLGNSLYDKRRFDEAVASYRAAVELRPNFAQAFNNLGIALKAKGGVDAAIGAFRTAVERKPDYADAFYNLGTALNETGRTNEAIAAFRKALELKPDSPDWQHVLSALCGDNSARTSPPGYVRTLFDQYAHRFDEHLVGKLDYHVPELFREVVVVTVPDRQLDLLDLGCGTGLCGVVFRSLATKLVGVDLSPAMIARAAGRGIYDRLVIGDLADAMRGYYGEFDLILAGDVFVYVGDLAEVFAGATRTLRSGGLLAFSLERHEGEGFVLRPSARFAHSLGYIRELSKRHGFAELQVREIAVRKEAAEAVAGWLVLLEKRATID